MHIHIASDHAGFELKQALIDHLTAQGHNLIDHGAYAYDPMDDYPGFCQEAAKAVMRDYGSMGVVIGGSGNGEQIAANKIRGVRAALVWSVRTAKLARAHNDANIAAIGSREHSQAEAIEIIDAFLSEPFSGDARHLRRIKQIIHYESHSTSAD
ncbi:MAG: ribose-5-phosphate isomerase [Bifidobacteriaceae bacterium]|jgi:ribose 5-phosphate isomerase B|nr:ribose-5-phosphate isomerase [Bifidobacteriaceae bacterium]